MGLFEVTRRLATRFALVDKAVKILPYLSFFTALAGIIMLLVLPMDGQFRNTYISENALLPAQAQTYFRETEWNIVRGYREEVQNLEHKSSEERTQTVRDWFDDIGLKTSLHHWDVSYGSEINNGTNVYGILHSPRGENTEAMVLVAPWINQDGEFNNGGVSLVVSLARYLIKWSLWSKNIIFVVTSDSHFSLRSWVSDYHTSMANTAGSIEAAIVLDYPSKSDYFDEVEIYYGGLNGQLPNLDLFNTAVIIAQQESLRVVIQKIATINFLHYKERALTLFRGIISQLSAGIGPGPGSETFSGWRIHAITLRARGTTGPGDITTFGRIAESTLRSINNLLEHFHQSFFFYFLLSPKKFISIGTYLPAAILLAIAYPLMAIYNIAAVPINGSVQPLPVNSRRYKLYTKLDSFWRRATPAQLSVLAPALFVSTIYASSFVVWYISLYVFSTNAVVYSLQTVTVFHVFVSVFIVVEKIKASRSAASLQPNGAIATAYPVVQASIVDKINQHIPKVPRCVLSFSHAYSMALHGLILTTLSMLNFSLAIVVGAATVPIMYIVPNTPIRSAILLLISSPWAWLRVIAWLIASKGGLQKITQDLLWSWRGLGVWTWAIIIGVWLPFWLIGLSVATMGAKTNEIVLSALPAKDAEKIEKKDN